ncbi:MAG: hypothetical protein SXA11_24260 [Cyanobacteriota bacterium]|nr:hypothetical protein [Cyanobacteriota bacterium]
MTNFSFLILSAFEEARRSISPYEARPGTLPEGAIARISIHSEDFPNPSLYASAKAWAIRVSSSTSKIFITTEERLFYSFSIIVSNSK